MQPPAEEAQKQQEQQPPPQQDQQADGAELGMGAGLRQRDVMELIKVSHLN